MEFLTRLQPIVGRFDAFLVDQYGVIHDGSAPSLAAAVEVVAVVWVAACPLGVVVVVVVRVVSCPESRPRSVSAILVASALRRKTV